jgi:hypothetical protein
MFVFNRILCKICAYRYIGAENGSGGWLDGILFYQGLYGFLGGNQQYTAGNLLFYGCKNGIGLIWDWSWV